MSAVAGWHIRAARSDDATNWHALRIALWPAEEEAPTLSDIANVLADPARYANFLAFDDMENAIGFAEASLRRDYVNGCDTSPIGFLEGWYVAPEWRGRGVGRELMKAAEAWARTRGCREFASDALLDSVDSHRAHLACGFEETERVVYFRKRLDG